MRADEIAWCSAFVNWCIFNAKAIGTGKPTARSWVHWGRETKSPQLGDIAVLWRGLKDSWQGHVAFYVGEYVDEFNNQFILLFGGNQNNEVGFKFYPKERLLEYRTLRPV